MQSRIKRYPHILISIEPSIYVLPFSKDVDVPLSNLALEPEWSLELSPAFFWKWPASPYRFRFRMEGYLSQVYVDPVKWRNTTVASKAQWAHFYLWLRKVLASDRRRYISNIFSHWTIPPLALGRKTGHDIPLITGGTHLAEQNNYTHK